MIKGNINKKDVVPDFVCSGGCYFVPNPEIFMNYDFDDVFDYFVDFL